MMSAWNIGLWYLLVIYYFYFLLSLPFLGLISLTQEKEMEKINKNNKLPKETSKFPQENISS